MLRPHGPARFARRRRPDWTPMGWLAFQPLPSPASTPRRSVIATSPAACWPWKRGSGSGSCAAPPRSHRQGAASRRADAGGGRPQVRADPAPVAQELQEPRAPMSTVNAREVSRVRGQDPAQEGEA